MTDGKYPVNTITFLMDELDKVRAAVRKHRDFRGDDRCWMDDEELYSVLPEGFVPPERDSTVEVKNCIRYIACRHNPATVYLSPEREIERLRAEVEKLRRDKGYQI